MLNIHHFRNATMVIETEKDVILVDPMLGPIGTFMSFSYIRFKSQKNPIVALPKKCNKILKKITHCLITHQHPDHIDKEGKRFLKKNNIPITCSIKDEKAFKKSGLNVVQSIDYWDKNDFLGGTIIGIPARHGYGFAATVGGNVMGFYIELPDQQSIYLSSDTIYTTDVDKVLKKYKPNICVLACGSAQLDLFKPLLMHLPDLITFIKNASGKIIANHLEALNHCPTTRKKLHEELEKNGLSKKIFIPMDGEILEMG